MRLLRGPDREEAEPHRRRHRRGELRHREGAGQLPGFGDARAAHRPRRGHRLHRPGARRRGTDCDAGGLGPLARPATARQAADHRGAGAAGHRAGDGSGAAIAELAMAFAHAGRAGRLLGRRRIPPRRLDQRAPRRRYDGYADFDRHPGRIRLVGLRAVLRRCRNARHAARFQFRRRERRRGVEYLFRGRGGCHRIHPHRTLFRDPLEGAGRIGAAGAAGNGRERRCGAAWRHRNSHSHRRSAPRRAVPGPSRREGRDGRHCGRGQFGHRYEHADRRVGACGGRARRSGGRWMRECGRHADRARHPRRGRHPARADGRAGRGGAERQGSGAAAGRPDLRRYSCRSC